MFVELKPSKILVNTNIIRYISIVKNESNYFDDQNFDIIFCTSDGATFKENYLLEVETHHRYNELKVLLTNGQK